jgi:uncharacterized protein
MGNIISMYSRKLTHAIFTSLADTPIVLICGARQTGKSTLVQEIANGKEPINYITFDDLSHLQAALQAPAEYVNELPDRVILDEVQYVPEIFRSIKLSVDQNRAPGRFLLTGSANVLMLPRLSESLAGRMEILTLWPLSQQEIEGTSTDIISKLFSGKIGQNYTAPNREDINKRIIFGGFPELLTRNESRKSDWVLSYIRSILEKDVRTFADINDLTRLPRLLSYLASQSGTLLNLSSIANAVDTPYSTLQRYMSYLQATYLTSQIPAWHSNLGLRLVKAPKLLVNDTGVITSLLGLNQEGLQKETTRYGFILETFVGMELTKLLSYSNTDAELFHYRTHDRKEIDFLLERRDGSVVAIEVKASGSIKGTEHKAMLQLKNLLGDKFTLGIVLYTGEHVLPIGEKLYAVPISFLWSD